MALHFNVTRSPLTAATVPGGIICGGPEISQFNNYKAATLLEFHRFWQIFIYSRRHKHWLHIP